MSDILTVSVVIPTRDRRAMVERAIRAALADEGTAEVVVVDDGSTDATPAAVEALSASDPRVRLISEKGVGPSRARQTGAEAARGDVVLFIDDDVVMLPGLATGHGRAHADDDNLVVIGYMPTIAPPERTVDTVPVHIYASDYEAQIRRYEADAANVLIDLWGGNVSLRRAAALRIGMHGPHPFNYHEDKDFGLRCRAAGMRGVFDRSLRAEHHPTRPFTAFLRVANAQGRDLVGIYQVHAEVLGKLDPTAEGSELPRPAHLALAVGTLPVLGPLELRALELCVRGLARPRWQRAQTGAAVLARAIAKRRGMKDAQRLPPLPGP